MIIGPSTPRRPAPKVSTKSPSARPGSALSGVESPVPRRSFLIEDQPSLKSSRDSNGSDDLAAPFIIRRETSGTPVEVNDNSHPVTTTALSNSDRNREIVDDNEPTKEDGSTIAKYVDRFRRNQPLSRVERARSGLQAKPNEFWWTDSHSAKEVANGSAKRTAISHRSTNRNEIGVAFKSPFMTSKPSKSHAAKKQDEEKLKDGSNARPLIPKGSNSNREKEQLAEEEPAEWTSASDCPAVSTDGLYSNLSSNDTGVLRPALDSIGLSDGCQREDQEDEMEEDLTFRPMFLGGSPYRAHRDVSGSSPPVRLSDADNDILARWRLRNQMELAREMALCEDPVTAAADKPSRHHFKRTVPSSTPFRPTREAAPPSLLPPLTPSTPAVTTVCTKIRDTGTQMSNPRSSPVPSLCPSVGHADVASAGVQTCSATPWDAGAIAACNCRCSEEARIRRLEKEERRKKRHEKKQEKQRKAEEKRKKKEKRAEQVEAAARCETTSPAWSVRPPVSQRRPPNDVIGDVVARGLTFDAGGAPLLGSSLRSSLNSMFPHDTSLRASSERIPASTVRSETAEPGPASLEELVATHEQKMDRFPADTILRQLRYQLQTKLEQIALIDAELRRRNHVQ